MAVDRKYGRLDIAGIADDEPVFVIRAKDAAAVDAIHDYFGRAGERGAEPAFLEQLGAVINPFVAWRLEHGDVVRAPD